MVACCNRDQFLICFRRTQTTTMAVTAGKIQPDFRQDLTVLGELADLGRVDLYLVSAKVAGEFGSICPGGLDQMRHVTLGT